MNTCYLGDCRDVMRNLIAEGVKVQTIVTSPPYYGLRNYGVDGQLGLEETPQQYIANMVEVFSVAWDLLADDGTLWLNIGDSYNGSGRGSGGTGVASGKQNTNKGANFLNGVNSKPLRFEGMKNKELMMIPARLAIALSDAGWYLRQDIIWAKPNVMPESVTDRCTKSHEHIFLLTKSDKYYFDNDAIKEISTSGDGSSPRGSKGVDNKNSGLRHNLDGSRASEGFRAFTEFRNKRDVWFIPSMSNSHESGGHFATFPEKIPETCILAGSKIGDIVFDPFMGSGTVGKVAQNLGRKWLGSELNPDYIKIQNKRTSQQSLELA